MYWRESEGKLSFWQMLSEWKGRERGKLFALCVCVCVWERERERERESKLGHWSLISCPVSNILSPFFICSLSPLLSSPLLSSPLLSYLPSPFYLFSLSFVYIYWDISMLFFCFFSVSLLFIIIYFCIYLYFWGILSYFLSFFIVVLLLLLWLLFMFVFVLFSFFLFLLFVCLYL